MPTGHTVPYRYRKHCKLVEKHFKARRFGIKNKLKPMKKPLIKI
jgi:hypothetical protein